MIISVPPSEVRSNVCVGTRVQFYWVDFSSSDEREHVERAVEALFESLQRSGVRLWNPFTTQIVKAKFRQRILKATRGELEPPDELKRVGDQRYPIYEIRWSGIGVHERGVDGADDRHYGVEVRLLHGEPLELGLCFVGLHAHEKQTYGTDAENRAAQDVEIDHATHTYLEGALRSWGVAGRT